jgi:hypothetical protein
MNGVVAVLDGSTVFCKTRIKSGFSSGQFGVEVYTPSLPTSVWAVMGT